VTERLPKPSLDNVRHLRRLIGHHNAEGRRHSADWPAELRFPHARLPCTVVDISSSGASVRIGTLPQDVSSLWLIVGSMRPIAGALVWRRRERVGLRFLQEQQWVVDLLAERFDPAAWLRRPR
jgi:hypothetical protein